MSTLFLLAKSTPRARDSGTKTEVSHGWSLGLGARCGPTGSPRRETPGRVLRQSEDAPWSPHSQWDTSVFVPELIPRCVLFPNRTLSERIPRHAYSPANDLLFFESWQIGPGSFNRTSCGVARPAAINQLCIHVPYIGHPAHFACLTIAQ